MAKKSKNRDTATTGMDAAQVPCLRVVVGKPGQTGKTDNKGCLIVGENRVSPDTWDLRRDYRATSKTVDFIDGKSCGFSVAKSGKNKGKKTKKQCPEPCRDAMKRSGCPVQLAFDQGQPFLRFCRADKKPGYQIKVNDPKKAREVAAEVCASWQTHGHAVPMPPTKKGKARPDRWIGSFEEYFQHVAPGTPLRGYRRRK